MHSGREGVVRGLAHIYIVIRVAKLFARNLVSTVGNNLVCVHVGLRARTRLPNNKREMIVKAARYYFIARGGNSLYLLRRHFFGLKLRIGKCRCLFEYAEGVGYLARHGFNAYTYLKVFVASFGLCRP